MLTQRELNSKKNKAKHLVTVKGYTQKEAAKILGVTEKTMSKWSVKYKWKTKNSKMISEFGGLNSIIEGFFKYVALTMPELIEAIKKQWTAFLKAYEKDIGN